MRLKQLMLATTLATACVAATSGALAWPGREAPNPEQRATQMQKALQLNDQQRKQVQQILESGQQQRTALEKKYTIAERDQFRDEVHKLRETQHSQIEALLTPAQREAMAAQRPHRDHHKGMGKRGDCPPPAKAN